MNSAVPLGFEHRFIPGEGPLAGLTLLLLHGTGGDGDSLLQLGYTLASGAALLSPTGNVLEGDSHRFFRRLREGVLDQADMQARTTELSDFVREAAAAYGFDAHRVIAVGYSNGANIAASILLREPWVVAGAVLFRPILPFTPEVRPRLHSTPVLVCAGALDQVTPPGDAQRLTELLRECDADVTLHVSRGTHELTMSDVVIARDWLAQKFGVD